MHGALVGVERVQIVRWELRGVTPDDPFLYLPLQREQSEHLVSLSHFEPRCSLVDNKAYIAAVAHRVMPC